MDLNSIEYGGYGAYPPQEKNEFERLCTFVRKLKPSTIMEVGARHGRSTIRLAEAAMPSLNEVIIIDLPGADWGHEGSGQSLVELKTDLEKRGVDVYVHLVDSKSKEAFEVAKEWSRKVEFLFIDGDHTYGGVSSDFLTFYPCVPEGGAIAFHDICRNGMSKRVEKMVEVKRFWDEIKEDAFSDYVEWIHRDDGMGIGLGVV